MGMIVGLSLLALSVFVGIFAYFKNTLRFILAPFAFILHFVAVILILIFQPSAASLLLSIFGAAQLLNISRLIEGRLNEKHLRAAYLRGGLNILLLELVTISVIIVQATIESFSIAWVIFGLQVAVSACIAFLVVLRLIRSRPKEIRNYLPDSQLPAISVLVPARNEDENLEQMLQSIVANDYPKLEVLVLDDCSATPRVSEIVKRFANKGVRFIEGDYPKENWLAKNQAYQTLVHHSSGDWLIFMGVDVRLGPTSLRALVHYAIHHRAEMVSVLPRRADHSFITGLFAPLRYFRELSKINLRHSVPALSTLWLIERKAYEEVGGIESVARMIIPEHYFASQLTKKSAYYFVHTNDYLQVGTIKTINEQLATSIRTLYPGMRRRIENVALYIVFSVTMLLMPFVQLVYGLVGNPSGYYFWSGLLACSFLVIAHCLVTIYTNPIVWPFALINFPYLVIQEMVLAVISLVKYEYGEVYWKGRNICQPVMHVIPALPPLPPKPHDAQL